MARLGGLALILCSVCALAQWREAKPSEASPTFKANISLVRVDAEVANGARPVSGLKKEDFLVHDNGAAQTLVNFGREEVPLDLILLFDVSGSMRPVVEDVASVAHEALAQLKDGDRVGVAYFTKHATMALNPSSNLDRVEDAIRNDILQQPFEGGTNIHGGIEFCGEKLARLDQQKGSGRRRAVLVITDNKGMYTNRETQIIEGLWEADVVVSGLIVNSPEGGGMRYPAGGRGPARMPFPMPGPRIPGMTHGMNRVAEETGGDCLKANRIDQDFPLIMQRLRTRYSLYYAVPKGQPGEHRRVVVELAGAAKSDHPYAKVYARKGYVIPAWEP